MAYKNAIMCDDETLVNSFMRAKELGALCTVHAENGELVFRLQQDIYDRGIHGPEGHPLSRPPEVEGEAANRAIRIAEVLGVPLYLVHTSCIDALEAVTRARLEGQRVLQRFWHSISSSIHRYIAIRIGGLQHHVMSIHFAHQNIRSSMERTSSRNAQTMLTDHCRFAPTKAGLKDFRAIPNGTGGVEDRMSVLWHHGVRTGRLTPSEFGGICEFKDL